VCHHNLRHTHTRAHKRHRQATCKGNLFVTSIHRNVCMCAGPAAWPTAENCCCGHEEQQRRLWNGLKCLCVPEQTGPSAPYPAHCTTHVLIRWTLPRAPHHTHRGPRGVDVAMLMARTGHHEDTPLIEHTAPALPHLGSAATRIAAHKHFIMMICMSSALQERCGGCGRMLVS
jgi:hypothetical protein